MDVLEDLNPQQREAVTTPGGPLLILAGPGSGKTRVITHRIAHLLHRGVAPWRILAVTFTNKAAREMLERVQRLAPTEVRRLTLGTFHSVCARLLRVEGPAIGLDSAFTIYDQDDQLRVMKQVLRDMNLDDKRYQPQPLLAAISRAKAELVSPAEYAEHARTYWHEVVTRVYRGYEHALAQADALDFDDLLMVTARLFRERPDVCERYQGRYLHILVDEFQDTNLAQYHLVRLLAERHRNVCVVGDEDQSIYGWRQADLRNLQHFRYDFPEHRLILLEQNYRSTGTIVAAAAAVIAQNRDRHPKELWTANGSGPPIVVREALDERDEATCVVREIARMLSSRRHRLRDFAVMYRTNAQSRAIEEVLVQHALPYQLVGAVRFFERREIKDLLAYARLLLNAHDVLAFNRVIGVPPRGIGDKTFAALHHWAGQLNASPLRALQALAGLPDPALAAALERVPSPFSSRAERALTAFANLVTRLEAASHTRSVADLLAHVVEESGYADFLRDGSEEGEERWQNVLELLGVARQYGDLAPRAGLVALLENAALTTDADELDGTADRVTLLTLHAAKGLEFPVVFIAGFEDGICPHSRSFGDDERMAEERRLCYVGLTRAKERLYLIHAQQRSLYGGGMANARSPYLADIPPHLLTDLSGAPRPGRRRMIFADDEIPEALNSQIESRPALYHAEDDVPEAAGGCVSDGPATCAADDESSPRPRYAPGDRVQHRAFGEGIIVRSEIVRGDEQVTVQFRQVGLKTLLVSFARLERL